jgi:NADH:ubiquinone oxidoreductase subunit F (NADH-binding)/(2Fe-2S) ferredoxin/Pyruvate/2-oxoacid:ferredoxin oxidoreductase delta subunit
MARLNSAAHLEKLRQLILDRNNGKRVVSVTNGTDGRTRHSEVVVQAFINEVKKQGLAEKVLVKSTGCHGFCEQEPTALILPEAICYVSVQPEDVPEIVSQTLAKGKVIERLLYEDPASGQRITRESEIPFYKSQNQIVLGNNRFLDMKSIDDYIALGGYSALAKALFKMTPERVIEEVKSSGLRGRGGAGFPTGVKWGFCRGAPGQPKYVIVNCDEGDPGAYMDRSLTEGNPHSVLEGLLIGAYAIGAHEGYIYVRAEYPLAVENLKTAIEQAEEYGLLGESILGSSFNFNVHIHRGAGAFVCGEETALIASLEGRIGEPRQRPPFPATSGLWGKPTNINNVETWATVPLIINRGARWFKSLGTQGSKGTKIFSLVGKLKNTGLVEVAMGIPLGDIVFKIGGGIPGGKEFKAVQTGGPSGGVIPRSLLDTPVDYEELTQLGSIMGSGGMIVMDEDTCLVDVARFFLNFLAGESCGRCVPCREGIYQMLKILNRICEGNGREGDIELLEEIGQTVQDFSLCALGKTAPNPVLSTIRYFRDEYEAHIKEKRCPALACKELISYYIEPEKCQACLICLRECPAQAITGGKKITHVIDQAKCTKCGTCLEVCPPRFGAVTKLSGVKVPEPVRQEAAVMQK